MKVIRNILAVIAGYLIFAVTAVALFSISGIDPHADASFGTMALVIIYGAVFAAVGGYAAHLISGSKTLTVNYVLSVLMAAFAAFSFFKSSGSHYTQIAAVFGFAPLSLLGGFFHLRRGK
jgi:hypothetical protein